MPDATPPLTFLACLERLDEDRAIFEWDPEAGAPLVHISISRGDWEEADRPMRVTLVLAEQPQPVADPLAPFEELFSGGPDTACRTTWRESAELAGCSAASIECVEVPMADLRSAFAAARGVSGADLDAIADMG